MEYFWKKKTITAYIMSVFVFFVHISSFGGMTQFLPNAVVNNVLVRNMPIFAVRLFFMVSGMLFFRNYSHKGYLKKIKSRIHTLLIPYLIWNTVWMLFEIVTSYTPISQLFILREKFVINLPNVLDGIFRYGCNSVFWFILQLMALNLVSPVIYYVIKNKKVALAFCVLFIAFSKYINDPTGTFFNLKASIYYIIGGIIGMHYFDSIVKKSSRSTAIKALIIFLLTVAFECLADYYKFRYPIPFKILFRTVNALAFWRLSDLFIDKLSEKRFYGYSFAVYAMHVNVQAVVCRLLYMIMPRNVYFAIPNFIGTVVLTLLIINTFCKLCERYTPKVYRVIMGER